MKVSFPEEVLVQTLEGESVLLNLESEQYFGLDDVGTKMWNALRETSSVEVAYEDLLAKYDVEPERLHADLQVLIKCLVEHGLVEITET